MGKNSTSDAISEPLSKPVPCSRPGRDLGVAGPKKDSSCQTTEVIESGREGGRECGPAMDKSKMEKKENPTGAQRRLQSVQNETEWVSLVLLKVVDDLEEGLSRL